MSRGTIVVVGAGQAGGWAAIGLRKGGYAGRVVLVGAEPHPPHERPPLSKAVLAGDKPPDSTHLFKPEQLTGIDCRPSTRAVAIDVATRHVGLEDGRTLDYDALILATGARARRLTAAGAELPHVLTLRTIEDAAALRARLAPGAALVVIGGGWIGLEVAATARKLGARVTVLEAQDRLVARAAPPLVSDRLLALHRANGVDVRLGARLTSIDVHHVHLASGEAIAADTVLVGIGSVPNIELAAAAGIAIDDGILVDEAARTSALSVFAAGDCAKLPLACLGRRIRLESWQHAQNHALAAARSALGEAVSYDETPWFWSDQYALNLQILGAPAAWGEPVLRGDAVNGDGCAFYQRDGRIEAVVAFNAARDLRAARRLLESGAVIEPHELADTQRPLARRG